MATAQWQGQPPAAGLAGEDPGNPVGRAGER